MCEPNSGYQTLAQRGSNRVVAMPSNMLAGNQAGLPSSLLNALSVAYLATRIAYIDAYIYSETVIVASLRATLFSIGHMIIWLVFILVGLRT